MEEGEEVEEEDEEELSEGAQEFINDEPLEEEETEEEALERFKQKQSKKKEPMEISHISGKSKESLEEEIEPKGMLAYNLIIDKVKVIKKKERKQKKAETSTEWNTSLVNLNL